MACTDPAPILEYLQGKTSERKLRLFAVACCRSVLNPADDECCLRAAQVAENFADGKVGAEELEEARAAVSAVLDEYPDAHDAVSEAAYAAFFATDVSVFSGDSSWLTTRSRSAT
jgi:hypothetical protein